MKKVLIVILSVITSGTLFAQLENTKWKSTLDIDGPVNVTFDFKKNTAAVNRIADGSLIENMTFTSDKSSFTVKKLEGQSDCDNSTPGKYSYKITQNKMVMNVISDDCNDRSSVINGSEWSLWKEPVAVKLSEAVLKQYVGVFQLDAAHPITVTFDNGVLYAEGPNNRLPKSALTPLSNSKFFLMVAGIEWDFKKDAKGKVISLISHEQQDHELMKVK